jgi:hypothetical protein
MKSSFGICFAIGALLSLFHAQTASAQVLLPSRTFAATTSIVRSQMMSGVPNQTIILSQPAVVGEPIQILPVPNMYIAPPILFPREDLRTKDGYLGYGTDQFIINQ